MGMVWAPGRGGVGQDVRDLGSVTRANINTRISQAAAAGGGFVDIPPGTYTMDKVPGQSFAIALQSGVYLRGYGATLALANGQEANFVNAPIGTVNCGVFGVKLDGNRANQTTGSGLRLAGVTNFVARDVTVVNATQYGMTVAAGTNIDLTYDNCLITDCGNDGWDSHNDNSLNAGLTLRNVVVKRFDRLGVGGKAGIDIRFARALVDGCRVESFGDVGAGNSGIRLREGESSSVNGIGGHGARIVNCRVESGFTGTYGYYVAARDVSIGESTAIDCGIGVRVLQRSAMLTALKILKSRTYGIDLFASVITPDLTTQADGCLVQGCEIRADVDGAGSAIHVETLNNRIALCRLMGKSQAATPALHFIAGSSGNRYQADTSLWTSNVTNAGSDNTGTFNS